MQQSFLCFDTNMQILKNNLVINDLILLQNFMKGEDPEHDGYKYR